MGNCNQSALSSSKFNSDEAEDLTMSRAQSSSGLQALQKIFFNATSVPVNVYCAHFTPSSFPMIPVVNSKNTSLCESSWSKIVLEDVQDDFGTKTSGMTVFYNEFYERLGLLDSSGRFEAVLSKHSAGLNKIAAKGAILVRIIKFVLKINCDNKQIQMMLFMLGKSHAQKHIRPWQYSVFIETLLITISSRLGTGATNDIMEAWVNLFAFVLQSMLPPAIRGHIIESELNINTCTEFDGKAENGQTQIVQAEEDKLISGKAKVKVDSKQAPASATGPNAAPESGRGSGSGNNGSGKRSKSPGAGAAGNPVNDKWSNTNNNNSSQPVGAAEARVLLSENEIAELSDDDPEIVRKKKNL